MTQIKIYFSIYFYGTAFWVFYFEIHGRKRVTYATADLTGWN